MELPSNKEIKRLAAACRKAGIRVLKIDGIEFTLTDEAPPTPTHRKSIVGQPRASNDILFESDAPSQEELLFWSSTGAIKDEAEDSA